MEWYVLWTWQTQYHRNHTGTRDIEGMDGPSSFNAVIINQVFGKKPESYKAVTKGEEKL